MQINVVEHPLALGRIVKANRPSCACRSATTVPVEGEIRKVIQNTLGIWYYLDVGITIRAEWVASVS